MPTGYKLVKAPAEYTGRMSGPPGWAQEHHVVWWENTGQCVPDGYVIHHRDENPSNNDFSNLEMMTRSEHGLHHSNGRSLVTLTCPTCSKLFDRERRQTHLVKKGNKATYCSRHCAGKAGA